MEISINELIENQELIKALYSLDYTFDQLKKDHEKKRIVLEEETHKMTTEFPEATNIYLLKGIE